MNVDLHTHTYPASDCSHITFRDYIAWCVAARRRGRGAHQSRRRLGQPQARGRRSPPRACCSCTASRSARCSATSSSSRRTSTTSTRFRDVQDAPRAGELPDDAAVVWVHPAAGGGRSGSAYYPGLERMVAGVVDAVEVYNGNWLGERYVDDRRADRRPAGRGAHRRQRRARRRAAHDLLHGAPRPRALHRRRRRPRSSSGAPSRTARGAAQGAASVSSRRSPDGRLRGADPRARRLRRHHRAGGGSGGAERRARRRRASSTCRTPPPA